MQILLYGALLLSQIGTGTKQYAVKKCGAIAQGPLNSIRINMIRASICVIVSLITWLVADGSGTSALGMAIGAAAGIGTALNLFTWILSAQRISLTLLEGVCTVGSLVVPLFLSPYLYNGEKVSLLQWTGAILVILSLFLFSGKSKSVTEKKSTLANIIIIFVCALGVTVAAIGKKLYTFHITANGHGSVFFFTLISFVSVVATFAILLPIYRQKELNRIRQNGGSDISLPLGKIWHFILIAATALYISEIFATFASDLPSAIYYPANRALGILFSFLLDVIAFKEKVTAKKAVGLVLLLTAVVIINI